MEGEFVYIHIPMYVCLPKYGTIYDIPRKNAKNARPPTHLQVCMFQTGKMEKEKEMEKY